jgi:hypothetical protein
VPGSGIGGGSPGPVRLKLVKFVLRQIPKSSAEA